MKHAWLMASLLLAGSCASKGSTKPPEDPPLRGEMSPLGVSHPDPMKIVSRVAERMESGQWAAACEDLADLGQTGRPVPLVAGVNVPADIPSTSLAKMRPFFRHLRGLQLPWVHVRYGPIRNVRNDPPMVEVPVMADYRYDAVSPREREAILHNWAKDRGEPGTWVEFVAEMQRQETARERTGDWPVWTFVWLRDRWRLYLGT